MLSTSAARGCGWIAHVATSALLRSAGLVDRAPWLVLDVPPPGVAVMTAWYPGWAAVLLSSRRSYRAGGGVSDLVSGTLIVRAPRLRWRSTCRGLLTAGRESCSWTSARETPPSSGLRVRADDGGRGRCPRHLVRPRAPGDTAGQLGVRRPRPADTRGYARRPRPHRRRTGDRPRPAPVSSLGRRRGAAARTAAAAACVGIRIRDRLAGATCRQTFVSGAAQISVLNPAEPDWERQKVRNDDSVVLEVKVGGVAFLLTGDITRSVEPDLVARLTPADTAIVKAPHHGSAGSSSPAFVDAVHPAAVVFSAGRRNPFGHPSPVAVARYRAAGARVFSTAEDGAVVFDTDGRTVRAWTWVGRREVIAAAPPKDD